MIRTIVGSIVIISAVLWLPLWSQLVLLGIGVLVIPYKAALLVPALFADALYAPASGVSLGHFNMTLITLGLIMLWYFFMTQTRIGDHYVSKTK